MIVVQTKKQLRVDLTFKMKISYTIIAIFFLVSIYSCSLEKRAITLNSKIDVAELSAYRDLKIFKRSSAYMLSGMNNKIHYRGSILMNNQDSIELISGTTELTRAINDDFEFKIKLLNAIDDFDRIGATKIDGSFYLDSVHYVKYYFSPDDYIIIFERKVDDSILNSMLGEKYYTLTKGLRYYVKKKQ